MCTMFSWTFSSGASDNKLQKILFYVNVFDSLSLSICHSLVTTAGYQDNKHYIKTNLVNGKFIIISSSLQAMAHLDSLSRYLVSESTHICWKIFIILQYFLISHLSDTSRFSTARDIALCQAVLIVLALRQHHIEKVKLWSTGFLQPPNISRLAGIVNGMSLCGICNTSISSVCEPGMNKLLFPIAVVDSITSTIGPSTSRDQFVMHYSTKISYSWPLSSVYGNCSLFPNIHQPGPCSDIYRMKRISAYRLQMTFV